MTPNDAIAELDLHKKSLKSLDFLEVLWHYWKEFQR